MKTYEHLRVDLSGEAIGVLERAARALSESKSVSSYARHELMNLANECRARLQHLAAGEPDISEGDPREQAH